MAQKISIKITAKKITTPQGKVVLDTVGGIPTAGVSSQDIVMGLTDYIIMSVPGANSTTDALIITSSGFQVQTAQEFADVATGLSSTDLSNSLS